MEGSKEWKNIFFHLLIEIPNRKPFSVCMHIWLIAWESIKRFCHIHKINENEENKINILYKSQMMIEYSGARWSPLSRSVIVNVSNILKITALWNMDFDWLWLPCESMNPTSFEFFLIEMLFATIAKIQRENYHKKHFRTKWIKWT